MSKPKLIVYSRKLTGCPCFEAVFNSVFDTEPAETVKKFIGRIKTSNPNAAVVCFCSANEEDAKKLLKLDALTGPLPMLTCSKTLTLDFVRAAARQGVSRFLCCEWEKARIETTLFEAIRHGGIKNFLETRYPGSLTSSPYIRKLLNEIVLAFPRRLNENDLAQRLGISQSWLQKLCRKAFDFSFHRLLRRIWVYQALRMMQHTHLNNTEIALQLNYSEESSLARDFRKEVGCSPNKARSRLASHSPETLLG